MQRRAECEVDLGGCGVWGHMPLTCLVISTCLLKIFTAIVACRDAVTGHYMKLGRLWVPEEDTDLAPG